MKNLIFFLCFFVCYTSITAQKIYTIKNETLELKIEVDGKIDLLWNIIDSQYRYFVRRPDGNIQELVNTKNANNKYQEEYKSTLTNLTLDATVSTENLNLTLYSLKQFFNHYNSSDSNYSFTDAKTKITTRLGVFGGITNQPFVENIQNITVPFFGAELEIFEETKMPRHTGVFSIKYALDNNDFKYRDTQLALSYRFRFINKAAFNIYANIKFATYTFYKSTLTYEDPDNPEVSISREITDSGFTAPFIFGIGSDIKITRNGFITLAYHEIFALFIDSYDNFPIDFAIGYKFNL